jgi:signal peptidase I
VTDTVPSLEPEPEARRDSSGLLEQIGTLLVAVLVAVGIRTFVVEPFRIPSGSMYPTLVVGDHLFVNKFVYGIRIPFTDTRLPGVRPPQRGDVVVFTVAKRGGQTFPADLKPDLPREEFVKRIAGLPGETIEVRGGRVFINGEAIDMRRTGQQVEDDAGNRLSLVQVNHGSRHYQVLEDGDYPFTDFPPTRVEPGRYFVLGDNRDHSKDSRVWGTVRLAELKGPAFVLYWSWDFNGSWGELLSPRTWWDLMAQKMRWERVGDRIY